MSAVGTLMITAAASLGALAAVRAVKRRVTRHRTVRRAAANDPVIDLEPDMESGVWRIPRPDRESSE